MKLWVNKDRTVLVRMSDDEHVVEVAFRGHPDEVWRAPIKMERER